MIKNIAGIILAAGEGTRMKSGIPKVLHKVCGKPMILYMLDNFSQLGIEKTVVVVGHKAEAIKSVLKGNSSVETVTQKALLGSGDAVRQARNAFSSFKGDIVVVCGDTPLIQCQSLRDLIRIHQDGSAAGTILTAVLKNPSGFGRIMRNDENGIVKIVEEQDADTYEKAIDEVNTGAYCFNSEELFSVLEEIKPDNAKKEYYLTDVIEVLTREKAKVESVSTREEEEALGVNSRRDLTRANEIINKRNIEKLLANGVTILDPTSVYIYGGVEIGQDTIIYPNTFIDGDVKIGAFCSIGPFARLRGGTVLRDNVQIGNFVEVVRSYVGSGSKIKHHSYIGDTNVGEGVNIGAGTITANYDGKNKNCVCIGNNAFIGVGTVLIAPVNVGKNSVTGAGSVVTKNKDIPEGAVVAGVPAKILKTGKTLKR